MPGTAFVYGTLMADEVVRVLINRVPTTRPATLHGYRRYRIKNAVYPAILPSTTTDSVKGKVRRGWCRLGLCGASTVLACSPRSRKLSNALKPDRCLQTQVLMDLSPKELRTLDRKHGTATAAGSRALKRLRCAPPSACVMPAPYLSRALPALAPHLVYFCSC